MKMKLLSVMFLVLALCACEPRISGEFSTPTQNEEINVEDNDSYGQNLVSEIINSHIDQTVSEELSTVEEINDTIDETIDQAKDTVSEVPNILTIDIQKVKDKIFNIAPNNSSEVSDEILFQTKVLEVVDADTVRIDYNGESHPLRILYIDSPEDTKTKDWLGDVATAFARDMLKGKTVTVELSEKDDPTDKYGRLLGSIFIGDTMYQEQIIKEGLAIVRYVYEPDTKYEDYLRSVEASARENNRNVWSIDGYVKSGNNGFDMSVIKK